MTEQSQFAIILDMENNKISLLTDTSLESSRLSLDDRIKENEAIINKKYDDIIKSRFTPAHFLIYWFFSSVCLTPAFYFMLDDKQISIILGCSSGIIISIFLRIYNAYRKKQSHAYADLERQREYVIKAMQYSFLHPSSPEGKATFESQPLVFQNAVPQQIQKNNSNRQPSFKKSQHYKWTFIVLFLIAFILLSLMNSINKTALYHSTTLLPATTLKQHLKEKPAPPKKVITRYKTDKDLRHCLKLPTKKEVIQCTEKIQ